MIETRLAAAISAAAFFMLASFDLVAEDGTPSLSWSSGLEYASGTYGGDADIEDLYLPVTIGLDFERVSLDLTVPYLAVRAPGGTTITDPGGDPLPGSGDMVTESGLGDVIAGITIYDIVYSRDLGLALDIAGRVKFGTADVDKGLGTGENDFTLRADLYKYLADFTLLGSIGYKFRGDPADLDLEDVYIGSVGAIYHANDTRSMGLILDYREASIADVDAVSELSAFVSHEFNDAWSVQFYVFTGFSDSSSDWGGGFLLTAS